MDASLRPEVFLGVSAVFCSESMRRLVDVVRRVAQSPATVLITGETGSGKELIARAVHHYSLRCDEPWVDVNCAALPEHLVESELFGYDKGAFSGADSMKPGLFELADRGTLFLDEIADLELKMQTKLLRVLDRVPYYRLGGRRKTSVDVRVVAATNHDLAEAVAAGKFRRDLFHRLSEVHLKIPPLRQRTEDVVPLAEFFLRECNPVCSFSAPVLDALQAYSWPGNVRELRNVVNRAALLSRGPDLQLSDLALQEQEESCALPDHIPVCGLDIMERQMIFRALEETGGHHAKAAGLLGISARTLTRKLRTYERDGIQEAAAL